MSAEDPLHRIAEQVADCFADSGYAFVEQDKIDELALMLDSFLTVAGIPVNPLQVPDQGRACTSTPQPVRQQQDPMANSA